MKRKRFLALLCMVSLLCMNAVTAAPALADATEDGNGSAQAQAELVS